MKFKEFKVGDGVITKVGEEYKRYTISKVLNNHTPDDFTEIVLISGNTILAEGEGDQEANDICLLPYIMVGSTVSFNGDKYDVIKIYNEDDKRLCRLRNLTTFDKVTVMLKDASDIGKWDYDNTPLADIAVGEYVHVTDLNGHTSYGLVSDKQMYLAGGDYKSYEVTIKTAPCINDTTIKLKGYGSCNCVDINGYKIRKLPKVLDNVLYHDDLFMVTSVGPIRDDGQFCIKINRLDYTNDMSFGTSGLYGIWLRSDNYKDVDTSPCNVKYKQMEIVKSHFKEHYLDLMEKNKSFYVCDPFTNSKSVLGATEGDYVVVNGFEDGDNKPGRFMAKVERINTFLGRWLDAIRAFDHLYTIDDLTTTCGANLMRIPKDIRMGYKIYHCGHPGFISNKPTIKDGKVFFRVHVYYKNGSDGYFEAERDVDIYNIRQINFVPKIEDRDVQVYYKNGPDGCFVTENKDRDKKNTRPMPDKITIVSDGVKKVQAISSMVEGTANCHPGDKFDIFAGAKIALDRLEKRFKD